LKDWKIGRKLRCYLFFALLGLSLSVVSCVPSAPELGGAADSRGESWQPVQGGENLNQHPTWRCIPSVEVVEGALVVEAGSDYVTPFNAGGPYVRVDGDFGLSASVQVEGEGIAAIAAFGVVPQGEWWRGIRRLDLGLSGGQVSVNYWDGTSSTPAISRYWPTGGVSEQAQLELRRIGNQLIFRVDGREVGRIRDPGAFPDDVVYLGANVAPENRLTIDRLTVEARPGGESEVEIVEPEGMEMPLLSGPSLRELAAARDLRIGAAVGPEALRCEPAYAGVLGREFSILTTENALKFGPVHPARERYDFEAADAIVEFAEANDMLVRGHTLVWHTQQPAWLEGAKWTRDELIEVLREHITTVVGRYRGRIAAWDVVNEAIEEDGSLRDTLWLRIIGPEYIDMAFRWAHEADPDALLFYNDYACEGLGCKSDAVYALVQGMLERDVPIHGVGLQTHLVLASPPGLEDVLANVKRLGDLGLLVHVTEMDVRMQGEPTEAKLERQAQMYGEFLETCLEAENCTAFVLWGFTDRHSWIPGSNPGWGSALIFDESYQPKPAYEALREVLSRG
jgi:endo-1,4-beta-xylanase